MRSVKPPLLQQNEREREQERTSERKGEWESGEETLFMCEWKPAIPAFEITQASISARRLFLSAVTRNRVSIWITIIINTYIISFSDFVFRIVSLCHQREKKLSKVKRQKKKLYFADFYQKSIEKTT